MWANTLSKSSYIIDFDHAEECHECVLEVEVQGQLWSNMNRTAKGEVLVETEG